MYILLHFLLNSILGYYADRVSSEPLINITHSVIPKNIIC